MDFLIHCYALIGASFAGYMIGTLDKEPTPIKDLVLMHLLITLTWPYWLYRAARRRDGSA